MAISKISFGSSVKISLAIIFSLLIALAIGNNPSELGKFADFLYKMDKKLHFENIVHSNKEEFFSSMVNVKDYPKVLPNNIKSVVIINQTENKIFAKEIISELNIEGEFLVSHYFEPYDKHIIEIKDGNLAGTKISISYESIEDETKVTTDVELHLEGPFAIFFKTLTESNLESAMNTVLTAFDTYTNDKK